MKEIRILILQEIVDPEKRETVLSSGDIPYETVQEYFLSGEEANRAMNHTIGGTLTHCPLHTSQAFNTKCIGFIRKRVPIDINSGLSVSWHYVTTGVIYELIK